MHNFSRILTTTALSILTINYRFKFQLTLTAHLATLSLFLKEMIGMKKLAKLTEDISCDEIVVLDFETTGLTPPYDRAIEVAAAIVSNNEIVDTFTHLMYPGKSIPYFITELTGITIDNPFLCTMILSRKLIPSACNHKLGTLASLLNIKATNAHRALADVKVTAKLWGHLYSQISERSGVARPALSMLTAISKRPKHTIPQYFEKINPTLSLQA